MGIIINHYQDPYETTSIVGKYPSFFFPGSSGGFISPPENDHIGTFESMIFRLSCLVGYVSFLRIWMKSCWVVIEAVGFLNKQSLLKTQIRIS